MQIAPEAERFGDIHPETPETTALFEELVAEGKIVARGPKEELQRLQDDLRKRGYRSINDRPLKLTPLC